MKKEIGFNNGFITALALFLEHKNFIEQIHKDKEENVISDLRLYAATDHLYDLEMPNVLSRDLMKRIARFRAECFNHRLDTFTSIETTDKLFTECEDILAEIDRKVFKTKKVIMIFR